MNRLVTKQTPMPDLLAANLPPFWPTHSASAKHWDHTHTHTQTHTHTNTHTHIQYTRTYLPSFCLAAVIRPRDPPEGGSKKCDRAVVDWNCSTVCVIEVLVYICGQPFLHDCGTIAYM